MSILDLYHFNNSFNIMLYMYL